MRFYDRMEAESQRNPHVEFFSRHHHAVRRWHARHGRCPGGWPASGFGSLWLLPAMRAFWLRHRRFGRRTEARPIGRAGVFLLAGAAFALHARRLRKASRCRRVRYPLVEGSGGDVVTDASRPWIGGPPGSGPDSDAAGITKALPGGGLRWLWGWDLDHDPPGA